MDQEKKKNTSKTEEISDFNIKDFLKLCTSKWWWFVICLMFTIGLSLFYLYRKEPEYKRYEQILVNDQDSNSGGIGDISKSFSSLGLFSKNSNVYNELLTITSPAIMYQVADTLQLDMNYMLKDGFRAKTLYGSSLPLRVDMLDVESQESAGFRMKLSPGGEKILYKFYQMRPEGKIKYEQEISVSPDATIVQTPIGRVKFSPNPRFKPDGNQEEKEIMVGKSAMQNTVELYCDKMTGDLADEDADVIELVIEDSSVERAEDILNFVLMIYNQNWIDDKNKMAIATSKFIDERLAVIEKELGEVDQTIAEEMKKTGIPNVQAVIMANMESGAKIEEGLITASNELSISKYMQEFLKNPANRNAVLPVNLGIESEDLGAQVLAYNELLLTRNNVANSSSESNPLVLNYDAQLEDMREAIVKSVDNRVNALQGVVKSIQNEIDKKMAELANTPTATLPILQESRQQEVKAALYLFLLEKREENELTQKFSADNVKVITPPMGPLKPVSPNKPLIIIIALVVGFGVPFWLSYFLESMNTTVRNKKDLESLLMPFAGEIPQVGKKANLKKLSEKNPLKKRKDEKPPMAVVEAGKRDVVNEAFRVVRGNIDFMSGKNVGTQVIMITSFNPGSGKSFIAYNLGLSFCLKNRRVLIIDCDLRHGSSSMYVGMPKKGLSDYLTGANTDWESLVVRTEANVNLDILPIGKIPPNPAELLEDGRLETLIEEAKRQYDLILLDCPPVNIVVDTQLVAPYADRTLFVVRAGLLERTALRELNEFYEEKKFKNISVILNGTAAIHSRYYTYGNYQNLN